MIKPTRLMACAAFSLISLVGPALALELDVLSDCKLQQTVSNLVHGRDGATVRCQGPQNRLDTAVLKMAAPDACLVNGSTAGLDTSFSCLIEPSGGARKSLSCFRPASTATIAEYKSNYVKKYGGPVSNYLAEAGRCAASNGDAAIAVSTMINGTFLRFSRLEVGFVVALADNSGTALHGFTSLDPSAKGFKEQALEVVYAFSSDRPFVDVRVDLARADNLRIVSVDDGREMKSAMRQMLGQAPVPIAFEFIGFDLTSGFRKSSFILAENRQAIGLKRLGNEVAEILNGRSFVSLSDAEFEERLHVRSEDYAKQMMQGRPYGARRANDVNPTVKAYFRESDDCSEDQGGSFALVAKVQARDDQPGEYGSVAVFLLAGGNCIRQDAEELRKTAREMRRIVKRNVED